MTAICGGGPSASKPGFNQTVVITSAAVEGALTILGLEPLAAVLAPFIAGETYDLTTFCNVDPPPDPGLTAGDLLDITNFIDPSVSIPAILKVQQWFKSWYWYQVCQCTSAATPSAPSPSNPGNVTTPNAGLPSGSVQSPCWDATVFVPAAQLDTSGEAYKRLLWQDTSSPSNWTSNSRILPTPLPSKIVFRAVLQPGGSNSATDINPGIAYTNAGGSQVGADTSPTYGTDVTIVSTPPPTAVKAQFTISSHAPSFSTPVTSDVTMSVTMYCSGQSLSSPASPCCPPDPMLEAKLNQIIGLVTSIYQGLPLPIISYAEGASHSVTGNGSFLIDASTIAVRVTITAISPQTGFAVGDPIAYFNAGWITPIAAEAPLAGYPVRYSPQVIPLPDIAEQVGYSLPPGAAVTIVELSRGP